MRFALHKSIALAALMGTALIGPSGSQADAVAPRVTSPSLPGYWLITGYGTSFAFNTTYLGSPGTYGNDTCEGSGLAPPHAYACDGISSVPNGSGYWISASHGPIPGSGPGYNGSANSFGTGVPRGTGPGGVHKVTAPIVGVAAAASGAWLVASDGGVFSMYGAPFFGSMGSKHLNAPIVGMASTPDGGGYWEVASDGGIFTFGDAQFFGSMGGQHLNAPIVGMASTPDGGGYWEVASDGGIFTFGDARFFGSMGSQALNAPIVGVAANPDGTGYWTVAADGGIFAFGDAPFLGSAVGQVLTAPIVGMAAVPSGSNPQQAPLPSF